MPVRAAVRILIVTDTHRTQTNGVVRTLSTLRDILQRRGHVVGWIDMEGFAALGWPTYPEIRLALWPGPALARQIEAFAPDAIHIATEGFWGWRRAGIAASAACRLPRRFILACRSIWRLTWDCRCGFPLRGFAGFMALPPG